MIVVMYAAPEPDSAWAAIFTPIGGNVKAASLSGINTRLYLFLAYVLCARDDRDLGHHADGAARNRREANIGATMPLEIDRRLRDWRACPFGEESARLANVVLGAIFIGLVQNGMNLARIESYLQIVVHRHRC